jgi:hypothetical protein
METTTLAERRRVTVAGVVGKTMNGGSRISFVRRSL